MKLRGLECSVSLFCHLRPLFIFSLTLACHGCFLVQIMRKFGPISRARKRALGLRLVERWRNHGLFGAYSIQKRLLNVNEVDNYRSATLHMLLLFFCSYLLFACLVVYLLPALLMQASAQQLSSNFEASLSNPDKSVKVSHETHRGRYCFPIECYCLFLSFCFIVFSFFLHLSPSSTIIFSYWFIACGNQVLLPPVPHGAPPQGYYIRPTIIDLRPQPLARGWGAQRCQLPWGESADPAAGASGFTCARAHWRRAATAGWTPRLWAEMIRKESWEKGLCVKGSWRIRDYPGAGMLTLIMYSLSFFLFSYVEGALSRNAIYY